MKYELWKKAILRDIPLLGLRATARKYGFAESSCTSLSKIVKAHEAGDQFAGMRSWKRLGKFVKSTQLRNPSTTNRS